MPENIKRMNELFSSCGIRLSGRQVEQFWSFYLLLEKYNEQYDLSRIRGFDDIIIKHFVDSVIISSFFKLPDTLLDIGTGAGFPGIPLKIFHPEKKIILAESKFKRVAFMKIAVDALDLRDIEIYPHLVTDKSFFNVHGVITRALESAEDTLLRVNHFLPAGGQVVLLKGPESEEEIDISGNSSLENFILELDKSYKIPGTEYARKLLVFRKKDESFKKLYRIFTREGQQEGTVISSPDNKKFKEFKKLTDADGIKKNNSVIVSGKKIIGELPVEKIYSLIVYDGYIESARHLKNLIDEISSKGKLFVLKKSLYNELDTFNTGGPLVQLGLPEMPDWDYSVSGCFVAIAFQNPENAGAVIRSGMALGAGGFIVLKECANPFHPKSVRASAGAVFGAKLMKGPSLADLADIIKNNSINSAALDSEGISIDKFDFPENFILIPGIEGPGLPESLSQNRISIPLQNDIESLNASTAVSIALYEINRRKIK
jgi:16S rRNA (guanine527-N7)-methyltransferase